MAANPTIQFKRKTNAAGAPASLSAGEPAFNTVENFLYVGNGSAVKWVGAEILDHTTTAFTSTTSLATRKAIGDVFAPLRSPVFQGTITGVNLILSGTLLGDTISAYSSPTNPRTLWAPVDGQTQTLHIAGNGLGGTSIINIGQNTGNSPITAVSIKTGGFGGYVSIDPAAGGNGVLDSSGSIFDFLQTPQTINIGAASGAIRVGSTTGTTQILNTLSVTGNATFVGDIAVRGGDITLREKGGGSDDITIAAPSAVSTGGVTFTLPGSYAASTGYVLQSDTSGNLSWVEPSSSVTVGMTATSNNQNYKMVFTSANASNTSASLLVDTTSGIVFNPSTNALTVAGVVQAEQVILSSSAGAHINTPYIWQEQGTVASEYTVFGILNGDDQYFTRVTSWEDDYGTNIGSFKLGLDYITDYDIFPMKNASNGNWGDAPRTLLNIANGTLSTWSGTGVPIKRVNIGGNTGTGNSTLITLGSATGSSATDIHGNLTVTGQSTFQNSATFIRNIAVLGGSIQTTSGTFNLVTTTASVINIGTVSAHTVNIGRSNSTTQLGGDLYMQGKSDDIATVGSAGTTVNLFNTTVTSINMGGSANEIHIGSGSSTTYFAGGVDIANAKSFTIAGTNILNISTLGSTVTDSSLQRINSSSLTLTGDIAVNGGDITSTASSFNLLNSTVTGLNIGGSANTVNIGSTTAVINLGTGTNGATVNIKGNLVVDGSTTTVNSTTVTIDDLNIVLADGQGTAANVDGGGITLGSTGITWNYVHGGGVFANWTSTENVDLTTGKSYKIGNQSLLSSSTLGPSVVSSSLTQVGMIDTGTWRGSVIAGAWGGTGFGSYTVGQLLYADTTTSLARLNAASTSGAVVSSTGPNAAPEYKTITVTRGTVTSYSGTLAISVQDALADGTTKGLATFNSTQFDDSSGLITLDTIDGGTYA